MRNLFFLTLIMFPVVVQADAGLNIGRPKAPCTVQFKGLDKFTGYQFFKVNNRRGYLSKVDMLDTMHFLLHNNESLQLSYPESRWHWPLKIIAFEKSSGLPVDSIILVAEGDNLAVTITSISDHTLKYAIERSKAVYPYRLFSDSETLNDSTSKRNKYILLALSLVAFITLAFMFYKRKTAMYDARKTR